MENTIWSFDIGVASMGECVRLNDDILHLQSNLIPKEFAEIKTAAAARRQMRTRKAHKAREHWLDSCMLEFEMEVLERRKVGQKNGKWQLLQKADPRLEREFPTEGDDTCYNSIALRCKLLLGHKLEKWQIYKALNSAIQLRGYDKNNKWDASENPDEKKKKNEEFEALEKFESEFHKMTVIEDYHYPAFFKAWKMGLWSPLNPEEVRIRIDFNAGRAGGFTIPRDLVEKECLALLENAAKQYPSLKGKEKYILYGIAEKAYASLYPDVRDKFGLKRGADTDWNALLGQKIPRFDNRIIDKCSLILRLNVCKIKKLKESKTEDELLSHDITLLMKLINMRVRRKDGNLVTPLSFEEFKKAYDLARKGNSYHFGKRDWKSFCKSIDCVVMPGHEEIEKPRESGRASFSRPAMRILKELLLSGKTPAEFYEEKLSTISNADVNKGLVKSDLDFLKNMEEGKSERIYLPDMRNAAVLLLDVSPVKRIEKFIGSQNDPIVRHRLFHFYNRLKFFEEKFGKPSRIILEFVRDDFMGPKKKAEVPKINSERRKERLQAAKYLDSDESAFKNVEKKSKLLLKYQLLKAQKYQCLYTGDPLMETKLDEYEIEHIVPRSKGGADSIFNYLVTTKTINNTKDDRIPAEWLKHTDKWQSYLTRVQDCAKALGKKRVKLLTSDNAYELMVKYTALAETAWISKLAQNVVSMHFDWPMGSDKGKRKTFIISGGVTARIRGRYKLNELLLSSKDLFVLKCPVYGLAFKTEKKKKIFDLSELVKNLEKIADEKIKENVIVFSKDNPDEEQWEAFCKTLPTDESFQAKLNYKAELKNKNRDNKKHHALDALCISFSQEFIAADRADMELDFGGKIGKNPHEFFKAELEKICPSQIVFEKARLGETIYGKRVVKGDPSIVLKRSIKEYGNKETKNILDNTIKKQILNFLKTSPSKESWDNWCENLRVQNKNGSFGARILKTSFREGPLTEYKDLSKDGHGAWRRGKHNHKGQIVWLSKKGKARVEPIYVHGSESQLLDSVRSKIDFLSIIGIFQSGCLVCLSDDVFRKRGILACPAGIYHLNSIRKDGYVEMTNPIGAKIEPPISLDLLLKSGFKRHIPDKD